MKVVISWSMHSYPKSLGPGMFRNFGYLRFWKAVIECIFCVSFPPGVKRTISRNGTAKPYAAFLFTWIRFTCQMSVGQVRFCHQISYEEPASEHMVKHLDIH